MRSGSLDPQGPVADAMAELWWLMLGLGVVVFVIFAAMLAVALVRRPTDESTAPPSVDRWILGWGAIGPAVVIVVVFAATVWAMRVMTTTAPADALVVEVVGNQWFYEISYPEQGVTATDELHIPTGRQIALQLTSADVIHSFWVPELAGKIDMLPDGVNTLVLQADEPGEHVSRCAEFCGLHHTTMQLRVVAEAPEQFEAWVAEQQQTAAAPDQAAVSSRRAGAAVGDDA